MTQPSATDTPASAGRFERLMQTCMDSRIGRFVLRWRRFLPVASFALGLGSYFLVQRQNALAQWLTVLMLVGWIALLFEGLLHRWLARWMGERLPILAVRFATQALHQETLFFVLPFFIASTTWSSPQCLFTLLIIAAAVASAVDPLYYDGIAARRSLFFGYHAFTLFVALLAAGPIIGSMTTGTTIAIASVVTAGCALPSFNDVIRTRHWSRWLLMAALSVALAGTAWGVRFWIPPATLSAKRMVVTTQMDTQNRQPGADQTRFAPQALAANGLYVFSAIKAPRGLKQQIFHVWSHNGEVVDRIPLDIVGGTRERGYRAWSHKTALGADPSGHWQVAAVTDDGQLIGAERFVVGDTPPSIAQRVAELISRLRGLIGGG
ncbi:DUF5924 family protein [uncultured Salinisphaera sp.]|uniref:DUF5924 family protein n=1 Tax=uncultured Salinisphaera sp. TaxID=359372 RepID=UPI0032B24149|tara:strand:- start:594 stop:1730 length:1137 start_codon:yes stop_codon:yes gene_type:complete